MMYLYFVFLLSTLKVKRFFIPNDCTSNTCTGITGFQTFFVSAIDNDTELTLSQAPTFSAVNVSAKTDFQDSGFVKFSTVRQVLT